jgi:hypothetical protein
MGVHVSEKTASEEDARLYEKYIDRLFDKLLDGVISWAEYIMKVLAARKKFNVGDHTAGANTADHKRARPKR